ncbi:MAG: hypothetical protein L3J89_03140 [Gammaproteobacteria bacterium]|nr:hypothetical protein [Gammaproteobacteria bacterium]
MIVSTCLKRFILPLVMLLIALTGCTSNVPVGDEDEAMRIAESYYAMLQNGEFDNAVELFEANQQGHWARFLQGNMKKLGLMTKYSFKSNMVNTVFSGKFYIYQISTRYGDQAADEILTLFLHVDDTEIEIASHKINLAHSRVNTQLSDAADKAEAK